MNKNIRTFSLGADPEMLIYKGRQVIEAQNVVGDNLELGRDGNGVLFEVRPHHSQNPFQVVRNIRDIFIRATYEKPEYLDYKWLAGSYHGRWGVGGHIHFGTKGKIGAFDAADYLDNYVGAISLLIENKNEGIKRRATGYGRKADIREQNHGFEYRSCSSWITSPYVALGMLCLAKTVMHEVLNNPKFKWNQYVFAVDFVQMNTDKLYRLFPKIWADITKMSLYQQYKPYLDVLYFLIKNKLSWYPSTTMQNAWGLINTNQFVIKENVSLDLIWERYKNTFPKRNRRVAVAQANNEEVIANNITVEDINRITHRYVRPTLIDPTIDEANS